MIGNFLVSLVLVLLLFRRFYITKIKNKEQSGKYNSAVNHYNEVVLRCLNLDDDMEINEENGCWIFEIEGRDFNHFCTLKFKIDDMYDQSKRLEKLSSLKENEYIKLLGEGNAAKLVQVISFELHKEVFRSKLYLSLIHI